MTSIENESDPWVVGPGSLEQTSPDEKSAIKFTRLNEFRMSSPLGGDCLLEIKEGENSGEYKVPAFVGFPGVWESEGDNFALPIWIIIQNQDEQESETIFQRLGVVNALQKTLTIYEEEFGVLHIKSFEKGIVSGIDSPIYEPKELKFDITLGKVNTIINLIKI